MSAPATKPLLSVVVTVVDGSDVLRRFLRALTTQEDPPAMEILVPFDSSKAAVAQVCAEFPTVTPVPMGEVPTFRPISTAAGQHEMFDRQRVAGLNRAIGELIAILEDRAIDVGSERCRRVIEKKRPDPSSDGTAVCHLSGTPHDQRSEPAQEHRRRPRHPAADSVARA